MKTMKILLSALAVFVLAGQVAAQGAGTEEELREAERRQAEAELEKREIQRQMREAERQLEEAARRIAELSEKNLPRLEEIEKSAFELMGKPRLGVTVGGNEKQGPVEGVNILGVSPGSPADDAGLRAGDVITAVNGESMSADDGADANRRLLDVMKGVEEGDKLSVEYLRDGNVGKVEVEPRILGPHVYAWAGDGEDFSVEIPPIEVAPEAILKYRYATPLYGSSWGDLELVELNEGLGRYFGTGTGLLVVSAPKSDAMQLQDGDVIESIDGREPTSVGHAMRILGSYQAGEKLEMRIMRDKHPLTLNIEIPDDRSSMLFPAVPLPTRPAKAASPVSPLSVPEQRT